MTRPTRLLARQSVTTRIGMFALLAALLVALALAPPAESFIYWSGSIPKHKTTPKPWPIPPPPPSTPTIGRANLDGTGIDESFIKQKRGAWSVAIDDAHIYWTDPERGVIGRARLDGTHIEEGFISGLKTPETLAVDDEHIYWTSRNAYPGAIARAKLDGRGVNENFISGLESPVGLAVDSAHLYWTHGFEPSRLGRANLDGTGVEPSFITGVTAPIAVDAGYVYWAKGGVIGRASVDGTAVNQSFATIGDTFPLGVAVDAGYIYWAGALNPPGSATMIPAIIGRANLDGTGADPSFITDVTPTTIAVNFSVGKVERANADGVATLKLEVPAAGDIALAQTKKVRGAQARADAAGDAALTIGLRGKAKQKLAESGKVKVRVDVTYTPDGGEPETQIAILRLKR